MREFFYNLITEWWGILIIVLLSFIIWILLSAFLYKPVFKRFYDIILSFLAILIFSPLLLLLIILGAIKMGGNPFFIQERPGKKEKIFKLIKFRTMTNKRGADGELLPDAERLTKYGKFLRATSLDELPELFNIFIGTMSIVGPRPLLVRYLPLYNDEQKKRHSVRPGLTGLAQISGRNAISWEQKFEKDVYYVENISFFSDIAIIFKTVLKVFKSDGISQEGNATMEFFLGNKIINILILSAGRRVELVKLFQKAKKELCINGKIIAADMSKSAPALSFADSYEILPRISDENYIINLISTCKKNNVNLVVPTIDTELPVLAANRVLIENETSVKLLLSSEECIQICRDKFRTSEFLQQNGFNVPHTLSKDEIANADSFPLFIKPYNGSSSINAFSVDNREELDFFYRYVNNPIIQEKITGQEYTIDIMCDFNSNPITIVPRKRIAVRSGEILKGQIDKNTLIISEIKKLVEALKPVGHITVQGFLCEAKFYFLEINPRFGGGAPMSIKAGADSCANIYRLLRNEALNYNEDYEDKLMFSRFDDCITVNND